MSATPTNPGSFRDFRAERTHHAVLVDEVQIAYQYGEALTTYREGLAAERGITLDELHTGHIAARQTAEVIALPLDAEAEDGVA